ncbi:efflux RND transporter periplasmic adaptor subunit [Myxococcaceae bacterium GXIMD 01537]
MTSPTESPVIPSSPSSRRGTLWLGVVGASLVAAGGLLIVFIFSPPASAEVEHARPKPTVSGESVTLPADGPQWRYVDLAVATLGPALPPLPAPGRVRFDEARTASVGAPLAGRVEQVRVRLGDRVKAGERLFSVRSGAYADLERERRSAETELAARQRTTARVRELVGLKAAPEKELQAAEMDERQAQLTLEAARAKQGSLKVSAEGDNLFWVTAPRAGTAVDVDVVASQEVTPERDGPLARISDLDEVLVVADLQEADALDLSEGQAVTVRAQGSGAERAGKVDRISEVVDAQRRTVEVRVRVANTDRALRPNAFVEVTPSAPADVRRVRVPASAVVTDGARSVVFVAREAQKLERVPVVTGRRREGEVELRAGLSVGERFVARGALLLQNQLELAD